MNPNGLAFFSAQRVPELAAAAKAQDAVMVQVTCFVGDLTQVDGARAAVTSAFPGAAANFVQLTRLAVEPGDFVRRGGTPPEAGKKPGEAGVHGHPDGVWGSGAGPSSGLWPAGAGARNDEGLATADALVMNVYSLNRTTADKAAALAPEFLGRARPVGSTQIVEGLPSLDATVAIELVAAGP